MSPFYQIGSLLSNTGAVWHKLSGLLVNSVKLNRKQGICLFPTRARAGAVWQDCRVNDLATVAGRWVPHRSGRMNYWLSAMHLTRLALGWWWMAGQWEGEG